VRHVVILDLEDSFCDDSRRGGHGNTFSLCTTSTVGVCACGAESPLWVALRPGAGSVTEVSVETFLGAVI
jgi:hypothetical protein